MNECQGELTTDKTDKHPLRKKQPIAKAEGKDKKRETTA